jgi:hypothetical protein
MTGFRDNSFDVSVPASDEIRPEGVAETHVLIDNGGLSNFHHFEEEEEGSNKAKIIGGGLVVALLLGAAGLYAMSGNAPVATKAPASQVASNAPMQTAPTPPAATPAPAAPDVAANTPADTGTVTKSPYDAAPVAKAPANDTASAAPDVKADKPVKTASKAKNSAALDQAESQQTAQLNKAAAPVDATPLPTPPAPPASSVATNGEPVGTQSAAPQEVPAAPEVTPEQQAAPVSPAPQPEQAAQPEAQPAPAQPQ